MLLFQAINSLKHVNIKKCILKKKNFIKFVDQLRILQSICGSEHPLQKFEYEVSGQLTITYKSKALFVEFSNDLFLEPS